MLFVRVLAASLVAHFPFVARADERIGAAIPLADNVGYIDSEPRVASDSLGAFVVWATSSGPGVYSARIDSGGNVAGPFLLASGFPYHEDVDIAGDGRNALVVWAENEARKWTIKGVRLGPTGAPLDATPLPLATGKLSANSSVHELHLAFDGLRYRLLWQKLTVGLRDSARLYTLLVGADGTLSSRVRTVRVRNMTPLPFQPRLACRNNGQCLVSWLETGGQNRVEGVRMSGEQVMDPQPIVLLRDVYYGDIRSSGSDYLVVGTRSYYSCGQSFCGVDAIAARVTGDGTPLDADGFRINNPSGQTADVADVELAFDGANYVASFLAQPTACGFQVFGARIAPNDTIVDGDVPGVLLNDAGAALSTAIAATRTHAVVVWQDTRASATCASYPPKSVYAQRALAHADTSGLPTVEIGAIGPRTVAEQALLEFSVSAASLDPALAAFTAGNLPPGAVFDATARIFRWKPAANEAGTYPGVHFEATDGTDTVSEDVTVTVTEGSLALCGMVERLDAPVPGVAVKLTGGLGKPRTGFSDATGRFCFASLLQRPYTLHVGKPSHKQYGAKALHVLIEGTDVTDVRFHVFLKGP
jgi:hypothetical protein